MIDLRSDTVTKPTEGMRQAMAHADVGDDVYGEDPTVAELQDRVAGLFGFEAALFTPTGSMANVLALAALVGPGQEVLCESRAHILRAELGAHGALTGLTSRTWIDEQGQIDLEAIRLMHAPDMVTPRSGGRTGRRMDAVGTWRTRPDSNRRSPA